MALRIVPDTSCVLKQLRKAAAHLSDGDSIVDEWFRVPCQVEVDDAGRSIVFEDDLGWFFQKCMLLVLPQKDADQVYFMGASAKFDGGDLHFASRDGELRLPEERAKQLFGEIGAELNLQLLGMEAWGRAVELRHLRDTYLAPIAAYSTSNL